MARAIAQDVNLSALAGHALRRWRIAVAILAAVVAGTALYALTLPDEFRARTVVSFAPQRGSGASSDVVRLLLPRYVAFATAPATLERVGARLGVDARALADAVDATTTADSGNVTITAVMRSPRGAANAANALAQETVSFAADDPLLQALVVAPALPDPTPSGPPRLLYMLASLVVGFLLAVAVAVGLERGRPRVRTWQEVSALTGFPVAGRLPFSRAVRAGVPDMLADPAVGAAVRTIRTNLERISRDRPVQTLAVTSSTSGEGKTTIAAALAVALARLGAEVLVVDADLHRPQSARLFGVSSPHGTGAVLRGEARLADAVVPTTTTGLSVLSATPTADASDLIARAFVDILRDAKGKYDIVIVDAPPLLGADDARTLAALCDGVLMVVAAESLAVQVSEASTALEALGVRVLGVVVNRFKDGWLTGYSAYGAYE